MNEQKKKDTTEKQLDVQNPDNITTQNNNQDKTSHEIIIPEHDAPQIIRIPVLPLNNTVVFPYTLCTLVLDNEKTINFILRISEEDRLLALFPDLTNPPGLTASKETKIENKEQVFETFNVDNKSISRIGTMVRIVKLLRFPDNTVRILVRGLKRVRILNVLTESPEITATVEELPDLHDSSLECAAMAKNAQHQFQEIISMSPNFPEDFKLAILNTADYSKLTDLVTDTLNINFKDKLGILTAPTLNERLHLLTILLNKEVEVLHLGNEIQSQVSNALGQAQREFFLREQLKAIKQELGEEDANPDISSIRKRMNEKKLPQNVVEVIEKEIERMGLISQASPDYHVSYNYVDWILSVPWDEFTQDKNDIKKAKKILDHDHYGLKDVKERILELLAVLQMKKDKKSPIICFVGPPGVGKTSLGQSIARAMGRKFVRMSLGGIRDEAEIRGHRRTYVGALPGRIIQGLKKAGSSNPVFMLDEIDKVGSDFRGDPSSALLEVLDPQQNHAFNDLYLEVDYDLSSVMFIATANILDTIPPALIDRMEIIRLPGYTHFEKVQIAKKFLMPRQIKENGLTSRQFLVAMKSFNELITYYTQEAGVRNLERVIGTLCRKVTRKIIEGDLLPDKKTIINPADVKTYLGKRKFILEEAERVPEIGLAIGMAWTSVGGTILPVESNMMPGKGTLQLTGSLGNVMQESAHTAFSYIKSNFKEFDIDPAIFKKNDFHLHVPDGATPKDGPSAGVTIAVSLVSLLTKRKVKVKTAMTGEITLRGKITAIGGLKEKAISALRSGIVTIVMPKQNEKDLEDIPDEVKEKMKFIFVENAKEAIAYLLLEPEEKKTGKQHQK